VARPPKVRRVEFVPHATYFKPAGIPAQELEEVVLTVEEVEALRLRDLLKLDQESCAERMGVSRATFQRILGEAREKVTGALIEGKALRISGGTYYYAQPGSGHCHRHHPGARHRKGRRWDQEPHGEEPDARS